MLPHAMTIIFTCFWTRFNFPLFRHNLVIKCLRDQGLPLIWSLSELGDQFKCLTFSPGISPRSLAGVRCAWTDEPFALHKAAPRLCLLYHQVRGSPFYPFAENMRWGLTQDRKMHMFILHWKAVWSRILSCCKNVRNVFIGERLFV